MISAWVEVVASHQSIATVRVVTPPGCDTCSGHSSHRCCRRSWLIELFSKKIGMDEWNLPVSVPLCVGQQLEVGVLAEELLHSVLVIYLYPVGGLLLGAAVLQGWGVNEFWVIVGALLGAVSGWLLARYTLARRCNYRQCQITILRPQGFSRTTDTEGRQSGLHLLG